MTLVPLLVALATQTSATVEVPFRLGEDAIIVDATVNNRKVSLMFDTGFGGAVEVDSSLDIGPKTGVMQLRDFVGELSAATAKIKSLRLGQKVIDPSDMEAILADDRDYSFVFNTHCDGIMGFEVLQGSVVEINFEKQKFIFHPSTVDITKRVPDNTKTFLTKLLPTGHNSLEMEVVAPTGKKLTLALDTGNSFYATTHKDVLERVGLWTSGRDPKFMRSSMVASGEVGTWEKTMKNMVIFGVPVPSSTWDVIDLPSGSAESDGTVGFGFLHNFNITFDYDRRRVWLENWTGKVSEDPPADLGLSAAYDPDSRRLTVVRVAPDSPAAKAGIKLRDQILSVDGQEDMHLSFRRIMKLFQGPKDSKAQIAISRGGNLMRFEVARDYLVND